ncbi:MAG TPA: hypothetical protein VFP23_08580 [Solirubrobacterales bacterium]|nr:hypothetical protein [Solirubrobacterales bacterium]
MGRRRFFASIGTFLAATLLAAPPAQATFHEIKVREVHPGTANDSYVELQMYAPGQTFLTTHSLTLYDPNGALVHTSTFSSDVANGANQATILIGDTSVEASFGVAPDLVDAGLEIPASGGAACWNAGGIPADCVAWGDFNGDAALENATGTSVGSPASPLGIAAGKSIRRTIASGCPTWLEASDDSNDSATDFEEVTPAPRDNASPIAETACTAPTATIGSKPFNPTSSSSASFTYHSTTAGASFECKLDLAAFAGCEAGGIEYPGPLAEGNHTFQVRAHNANGTGTPASYTWTVDTTPPVVEIKSHPADPSPGNSAAFSYESTEAGSSFECSLEPGAEAPIFTSCPVTGKTYPDAEHPAPLADGEWTFEVRAIDKAGNRSVPGAFPLGTFGWTVDSTVADTTPPETTILSHPQDPTESSTATFTYASNEAGSSFQCALDGTAFAACPASGVTYPGLVDGLHSFQVRAIDPSGNVDPTPAGYSFSVVLPLEPPSPPDTRLIAKPPTRTRDRTPTLRFGSTVPGASFQCGIDRRPFRACRSPFTTRPLSLGRHLVRIRAVANGLVDPTPASVRIKVVRHR